MLGNASRGAQGVLCRLFIGVVPSQRGGIGAKRDTVQPVETLCRRKRASNVSGIRLSRFAQSRFRFLSSQIDSKKLTSSVKALIIYPS